MKYETIKTAFLVVLVVASVFLTWSLMTFQIHSDDTIKEIPNKPKADERLAGDVIIPMKILLHEKSGHFGTTNDNEIDRVMGQIRNWKFYGVGDSKIYKESQINTLIEDVNHLELVFPDLVPFEIYKGVIQFNDKELLNVNFDKIVIDLSKEQQKVKTVYFINSKNNQVYSGSVSSNNFQEFVSEINNKKDFYLPYISYRLNKDNSIFLPKGEMKELSYTYYWNGTDMDVVEKYKKALFTDPKNVQKGQKGNFIEFTDGTSFMKADTLNGMIRYVNPGEETDQVLQSKDLLKKSIDFVNQNGGWTNNFYYFNMNLDKHTTSFRFFKNGLPVFNAQGMAQITENFGELKIFEFERPYIDFEKLYLPFTPTEVPLPSAEKVLDFLINQSKVNMESVDNIVMGYTLRYDSKQKILYFGPSWYYHLNDQWIPFTLDGSKGERHGLE